MRKFIEIVKTIASITGLLSLLFFVAVAVGLLMNGYILGDCVTVPIVGIQIPFCRQPIAKPAQPVTPLPGNTAQPNATFTEIPEPTSHVENIFELVSLDEIGGVQASKRSYLNVDFLVGEIVTTQSEVLRNKPDKLIINVHQTKRSVSKIHFLWQAGWGTLPPNTEFGRVDIVFSDGNKVEEILKIGYDIRDWSVVNSPLTAPYAQEALKIAGNSEVNGQEAVVDMITFEIPTEFRYSSITRIEIYDESSPRLNSLNPAIHLWAITLE